MPSPLFAAVAGGVLGVPVLALLSPLPASEHKT